MMNRLIRIGAAALLTTALAGSGAGAAWAQDDDEESESEDDADPCAGIEGVACGESSDEGGDDEGGEELAGGGKGDEGGNGGDDNGDNGDSGDGDDGESSVDAEVTAEASMGPTLPAGQLSLTAALQVGLADGAEGDPLAIAPDVWYGINPKLSAGLVTSAYGQSGFWGADATGVCVSGDACVETFNNVGAEALYALKSDASLSFAVDAGLHALAFDPLLIDAKIGAKGAWRSGSIEIGFAPSVLVALTERGDEGGNYDQLLIPVDLAYLLSPKLRIGVQSGIKGSLQNFGEDYAVPVALGGFFMISPKLFGAVAFSLDRVTGGSVEGMEGPGATDLRSITAMLGYLM